MNVYNVRDFVHHEQLSSTTLEIHLEKGSSITLFHDVALHPLLTHVTIIVPASTRMHYYFQSKQSATISIRFQLVGEDAQAIIRGFYALENNQEISLTTYLDHQAEHTTSDLLIKGLLYDTSKAHYEGTINIEAQARKAHAAQYNKNMLMHPTARASSKPYLQVHTHEVQCKHGSAVGQFNKEHLFYMMSRGMDELSSKHLLIEGFLSDVRMKQ